MKQKPNIEEFIDLWLVPYHGITLQEVKDTHPEWMKEPQKHTRDFYDKYAVTQEQRNEWYKKAIEKIMKHYRFSKRHSERAFAWYYNNCAPTVKE